MCLLVITVAHVTASCPSFVQVLMLCMRAPRSYTREDVVELHVHGGGVCASRVLQVRLGEWRRGAVKCVCVCVSVHAGQTRGPVPHPVLHHPLACIFMWDRYEGSD